MRALFYKKKVNEVRTFLGNGTVWDKENDKTLCQFVDGKVKTDVKRVADILTRRGYKEVKAKASPPKPQPKNQPKKK